MKVDYKNINWINDFYTVDGETYRSYDNNIYTPEQIFTNELGFFFKKLLVEHNLDLYYVYNEPKHKILFSKEDLNFFKEIGVFQKNLKKPENINIIRNMQYKDLLNFYNIYIFEGVEVFIVISKIVDNYYYYDFLIAVKKNFNLKKLIDTTFDVINIKYYEKIYLENLNFNYVQNLFDFKELESYSFKEIREEEYTSMMNEAIKSSECERSKLDRYGQYCDKNKINTNTDSTFIWYRNESSGKFNESINDLIMFENFSKNFGWLFFVLSHEFRDADAEIFYKSDLTYDDLSCFIKGVPFEEEYAYFGFYDMIGCLDYCIILHNIFMKKFEYGTTHKQRLRLFKSENK